MGYRLTCWQWQLQQQQQKRQLGKQRQRQSLDGHLGRVGEGKSASQEEDHPPAHLCLDQPPRDQRGRVLDLAEMINNMTNNKNNSFFCSCLLVIFTITLSMMQTAKNYSPVTGNIFF